MRTLCALCLALATTAGLPAAPRADGFAVQKLFGQGRFLRTADGSPFVPRGLNYVRIDSLANQDTLDPTVYDSVAVEAALLQMQANGFNAVRITLDSRYLVWYGGFLASPGIPPAFAQALNDFLQRAANHNLAVLIAGRNLPKNYVVREPAPPANVTGINGELLAPGWAEMRARYWTDLIAAIPVPLRRAIFSIDIYNEAEVSNTDLPFSSTAPFTFNGMTYDMAHGAGRQALIDAATAAWAATIVPPIKVADPAMQLTVSLISPYAAGHASYDGAAIGRGYSNLFPLRFMVLYGSALDFADIHTYPLDPSYSSDTDFRSLELRTSYVLPKPLMLSEYGIVRAGFPAIATAANVLAQHLQTSCSYSVSGWAYWTWDTTEQGDPIWTATQSGGVIDQVIAPSAVPMVCAGIPAGNIVTQINGVQRLMASNGSHYCWYDTWAHFLTLTGFSQTQAAAYETTLPVVTHIPTTMRYDGPCGGL